jgi:ProP effector
MEEKLPAATPATLVDLATAPAPLPATAQAPMVDEAAHDTGLDAAHDAAHESAHDPADGPGHEAAAPTPKQVAQQAARIAAQQAADEAVYSAVPAALSAPALVILYASCPTPDGHRPADLSPGATVALLGELFPALFGLGWAKPIKLRIQADIQARAPHLFSKKALSVFLHRHTTSTPYLKSLLTMEQRFDLDGQVDGVVAPEHRQAAEEELGHRWQMVQERRAAERGGQRPQGQDNNRPGPDRRPPTGPRGPRQDQHADQRQGGDAQQDPAQVQHLSQGERPQGDAQTRPAQTQRPDARPPQQRPEFRRDGPPGPRSDQRPDQRPDQRGGPRGDGRGDARSDSRGDPRSSPRPDQRGDQRPGQNLGAHPRPQGPAPARMERAGEPRGEHRGVPRSEPRSEPRSDQRNDSRGDSRSGPRGERADRGDRGDRGSWADQRGGPGRPAQDQRPNAAAEPPLPDDPVRRERAVLLRTWEASPLTPANFCALKGLKVPEFEARIAQAQQERREAQQAFRAAQNPRTP